MPDTRRHPDDRLRLTRLARGQSQGDLARAAGITRQAISGIESGRWSPSLEVALAVARALDSSVEDLFGEAAEAPSVSGRLAVRPVRQQGSTAPKPLLLSEVAGDTVRQILADGVERKARERDARLNRAWQNALAQCGH